MGDSDPFAAFGAVRRSSADAPPAQPAAPVPMNQMPTTQNAPPPFAGGLASPPPACGAMGGGPPPGVGMAQPGAMGMRPGMMGMQPGMMGGSMGGGMGMGMRPGMQPGMMGGSMGGGMGMGMQGAPGMMQGAPVQQAQPAATLQPTQSLTAALAAQNSGASTSLEASLGLAPALPAAPAAQPAAPVDLSDPFSNPIASPSSADAFASDPFSFPVAQRGTAEPEEEEEDAPGAAPGEVSLGLDGEVPAAAAAKAPTVLSRQDTFKYLEELTNGSAQVKVDAARALKSLAFNANAEYKEGLLKGGVPRLLMVMISDNASIASLEQATSCMYSMAREHLESKVSLVKAGALRALATSLLHHQSKQCQLNSCATLYAISCAGREVCKQLAAFKPLDRLRMLVNPGPGRTPQDDQLQLFAALLIVNLLHVKGITSKEDRAALAGSLQRAFDDATETQVRETIAVGLKRLSTMGSRRSRLSQTMASLSFSSKKPGGAINPGARPGSGGSSAQGFGSAPARQASSGRMFSKKKSSYQGSDSAVWND